MYWFYHYYVNYEGQKTMVWIDIIVRFEDTCLKNCSFWSAVFIVVTHHEEYFFYQKYCLELLDFFRIVYIHYYVHMEFQRNSSYFGEMPGSWKWDYYSGQIMDFPTLVMCNFKEVSFALVHRLNIVKIEFALRMDKSKVNLH